MKNNATATDSSLENYSETKSESTSAPGFFSSPSPVWLGLLLFFTLKIAFLSAIYPNDYWWYVRLGQDIFQNGYVPVVDSFTYTQAGEPFVFHSWLSSVLFWLFRDQTLTVFIYGLILATFYTFIWLSCRIVGAGPRLAMVLTLLASLAGSANLGIRPQVFSFPLFGCSLYCLLLWRQGKSGAVWALPVIGLLWVNLHGAFPLMFLLAGAALVGGKGDRKILALALTISFLATLVNPRGIGAWYYVYSLLSDPASQQLGQEWQSPSVVTWQGKLYFLSLLVFPVVTSLSSRKLGLTDWLWFLGFGWMAISGMRYMVWFMAVFAPITAILLAPVANRTIDRRKTLGKPAINVVLFVAMLLGPLTVLPGVRERWMTTVFPVYTNNTPFEAASWIKSHPELPSNIWADLAMSSYLIFTVPERPVWIDPRFELFPVQHWKDYVAISNASHNWESLLERDNVKLLLLDHKEQKWLIEALSDSPNWVSPYNDELSIIFTAARE